MAQLNSLVVTGNSKFINNVNANTIDLSVNSVGINFRPTNSGYYTTTSHQTSGNEALVFASKNAVTSFMFVNGEDSVTNHGDTRWRSLIPGLQIKQNCVSIGKLIDNGVTPSYKLEVNGTTRINEKLTVGSSAQATLPNAGIHVHDVRNVDATPGFLNSAVNFYFTNRTNPYANSPWYSVMHVNGWVGSESYNAWELAGPSHTGDQRTIPLYVRTSNGGTWGSWRKIYDTSNPPTYSEVGAAASGHNHDSTYLKLSGGTLTGALNLSYATSATMTYASTNPQIGFSENGSQGVKIIYTDYDSYRTPYGLKVIGDGTAGAAWFEVEGSIFCNGGKYNSYFTATPTSGQVAITDGTTGGIKSSGYTIAKSVPSNAVFTDTTYTIATGDSNGQIKVTPSSGSAYNVGIKGLNTMAYENKDDYRKRYLAEFGGNGDSAGYCKVCTITITSGYINGPIEIALQERGRATINRLYIMFNSVNNSDPSLASFKVLGSYTGYYIYKVATSKWEVYAAKNEAWSGIWVIDCSLYSIKSPGMTIAWNMENASLPSSGTTQATHIYATSDTNTHRPIQMNGTEILGNNTTALNLKAGSNVSLTNSSGTVTIAATNTLNTAGSTDTSSKIFLIGATSQAANPQTYSDNEVYATSGVLTTKSVQVGGTAATMQYNSTNHCIDFIVT